MKMRIDYDQGDHLRVGRLLLARARNHPEAPIVDGATTTLFRADEEAAMAVVNESRALLEAVECDTEADDVNEAARHVGEALATFDRKFEREHFGALVVHRPGRVEAVAVGWLGVPTPHPYRWRPRALLRHLRWVAAGRPVSAPMTAGGEERAPLEDDGAFAGHPGGPFGDGPVELWASQS